jgi:hypothetical protein
LNVHGVISEARNKVQDEDEDEGMDGIIKPGELEK